eukprot:m.140170 g.140170  ORF g.140170 m.140170 type:complete len:66 (-) comp14820_c0_seq5:39-236(-)
MTSPGLIYSQSLFISNDVNDWLKIGACELQTEDQRRTHNTPCCKKQCLIRIFSLGRTMKPPKCAL